MDWDQIPQWVASSDLDFVASPYFGVPKVVKFRVRIAKDVLFLANSETDKTILAQAAQYGIDSIRQAIGTAVGEFSFLIGQDHSLFDASTKLLTVTWTSRCRAIKPPDAPLQYKDIFGE